MKKNNERILKEMASNGLALKMELQKIETEYSDLTTYILESKRKQAELKTKKTKCYKQILALFQ